MRYQQHINGSWLILKNQLKNKYPSLTDLDRYRHWRDASWSNSDFGRQAPDDTPAIH